MRETNQHKSVAILFADIVGYTSLMQANQAAALEHLEHFKQTLENTVPTFEGEIIQFYGDGCLVIFATSLGAVDCAKNLQDIFVKIFEIPVRIGLHFGEVVRRDGNVYSHAVNLASRVESLGVPGSILMTDSVQRQIQEDDRFKLATLGEFDFKNVSNTIPVFALANEGFPIPKRKEMQGKLKEKAKKTHALWLVPILTLLIITIWQVFFSGSKMEKAILTERIAVLPFENKTHDPNIEVLGEMAADWINQGLMSIGEAEVVSPFTVRTHKSAIGIMENDPQNRPSFAKLTGAKNLITGKYYKDQDNIIFKLELVDALAGKLRFSFKDIKGKAENKEALITQLREQVTGYWAARDLVDDKKITPPKLEAYELYLTKLKEVVIGKEYREMLAIDSTFYLARLNLLQLNIGGTEGRNSPHFEFLERHASQLSEYELTWYNYLKNLYIGNNEAAYLNLNALRLKYPKDFLINDALATTAFNGLNNPELTLQIYAELPLEESHRTVFAGSYNHRVENTVFALIQLGKIAEAASFLANTKHNLDIDNYNYIKSKVYESLARKDEKDIIENYMEMRKVFDNVTPFRYFYLAVVVEQSNLVPVHLLPQLQADIISFYQKLASKDVNRVLWRNVIARMTNKPEMLNIHQLNRLPKSFQIINLGAAGQLYIVNNQLDSVKIVLDKLQQMTTPDYEVQSQVGAAYAYYFIARIHTLMGNYGLAIDNLQKTKELGAATSLHRFQFDRYLTPLFELSAFKELTKPIMLAVEI